MILYYDLMIFSERKLLSISSKFTFEMLTQVLLVYHNLSQWHHLSSLKSYLKPN